MKAGNLWLFSFDKGTITFPIQTPGEMTSIQMGGLYRACAPKDGYEMQVSFDDGQTFTTVGKMSGPFRGNTVYATLDKIPAGTKLAKIRFAGRTQNTTMMFNLRIGADYKLADSGFAPVQVTDLLEEAGTLQEGRSRCQAGDRDLPDRKSATRRS